MTERARKIEAFLSELAPIVDGDPDALERHAELLVDDDEGRDLRHDAAEAARMIAFAGDDYVPPADLEARVMAALERSRASEPATPSVFVLQGDGSKVAGARESGSFEGVASEERQDDELDTDGSAEAPTSRSTPPPRLERAPARSPGRRWLVPSAAAAAALVAAALLFVLPRGQEGEPAPSLAARGIAGTLEVLERAASDGESGVTLRKPGSDEWTPLRGGEALPAGSIVRTDERTRARILLDDGSRLILNHDTELELVADAPRSVRVREGDLVADVAHREDAPNAFFHTANGHVEVLGTKFELAATDEVTVVRVSRGAVALASADGRRSEVYAGEEGVLRTGEEPEVSPATDLARTLAWSELGGDAETGDSLPGLGSLKARRPGEREDRERPLTIASQKVTVRIVGNVARTEVEQVFRNDDEHTLEGIYRFPLPPDAQIARLALDVDGRMEEGSFVERDRAAAIWRGVIRNATPRTERKKEEEFVWVPGPWIDPAILEWQRGGEFELRIFPIPARGERRVILAYTQTLAPQGDRRRYVYPLAHAVDGSTEVHRFDVDVRVAGAEHVSASGYAVSTALEGEATRLRFSERGFVPRGDLVVDYRLPGAEQELTHWTYRGRAAAPPPEQSREPDREVLAAHRALAADERGYVAFALRPRLPRMSERRARDYVFVVDASQSMVGERFRRAAGLSVAAIAEMDRRDRFGVFACDITCRALPGGVQAPSAEAARRTAEWLESLEPAGASDLLASLREALASVEAERRSGRALELVYVGDGISTVGYRRVSALSAEVRELATKSDVRVSTVGIGGDADALALSAIARAGAGHYVPYVPGQRTAVAAMSLLETSYGVSLESPRIEFPAGLAEIAPSELPTIRAGQELVLVARMERERVQGQVVLRGEVAGRPFEQRYRVDLQATEAVGNRFVPRLWAAAQIEERELRDKGEERAMSIALSKAYGVMSRHTSLLVLESEAMFRAFRVDRNENAIAGWTGEEEMVAGGADGELETGDAADPSHGRLGSVRARAGGARRLAVGASAEPLAGLDGLGWDEAPRASAAPRPPSGRSRRARPRQRGEWMRRVWVRVASTEAMGEVTSADREEARRALEALKGNEDSRDRHRDAVRKLARAGELERALEIADAWIARDRLDPEALTAKSDLLGRLGHRDEALRLLTGTVDLVPHNEALHERLASAFERANRPERACAHRIALAEIDADDVKALAAAVRCERALGRDEAAERLLSSVRDARVRARAEREARRTPSESRFGGDFTIEGEWDDDVDLDLSIITPEGTRLSWMGGRTGVRGEEITHEGRERLGLRFTRVGTYYVEVSRVDPNDRRAVRGRLRIRVLGTTRTVPFTLRGERESVARVRVMRQARFVPVDGRWGGRRF